MYTHKHMRAEFQGAANKNCVGIDHYKDNTANLEEQNEYLAKENDELKQGAIDSVKLIHSADELQKDLEYLSS